MRCRQQGIDVFDKEVGILEKYQQPEVINQAQHE